VEQGTEVLRTCLLEAESIDPTNAEIAALYYEAQAIELAKAQEEEARKAYLARVAQGKSIYNQAKDYQKHGDWKRALKKFNEFIKSQFPDPGKYKDKARREVASINLTIGTQIEEALKLSKMHLQNGEYKDAILAANKGLDVNRDHVELLEVKGEADKLLKIILRRYYQESIIEEDFGEIAEAKIKWKKILEQGVEGSEYYSKAQLKLKYYEEGFQ
jgi:tetratricopeptide (TPR) repeat protein